MPPPAVGPQCLISNPVSVWCSLEQTLSLLRQRYPASGREEQYLCSFTGMHRPPTSSMRVG